MKINKLRMQIQFEKYIDSLTDNEFCKLDNEDIKEYSQLEIDGLRWDCAKRHIVHLERALKKEMFVNEIEKPKDEDLGCVVVGSKLIDKKNNLEEYLEAEKKVIFDNIGIDDNIIFLEEDIQIHIALLQEFNLEHLARLGNGELKLKNIEL